MARSSLIWFLLLRQPHCAQCFPSLFLSGHSACRRFPEQAQSPLPAFALACLHMLAPSHPSGLSSDVTCPEPPSPITILYGNLPLAIFVLLWFHCSSLFHLIHIWHELVYLLIVWLGSDCQDSRHCFVYPSTPIWHKVVLTQYLFVNT